MQLAVFLWPRSWKGTGQRVTGRLSEANGKAPSAAVCLIKRIPVSASRRRTNTHVHTLPSLRHLNRVPLRPASIWARPMKSANYAAHIIYYTVRPRRSKVMRYRISSTTTPKKTINKIYKNRDPAPPCWTYTVKTHCLVLLFRHLGFALVGVKPYT